jgi:zinc protease
VQTVIRFVAPGITMADERRVSLRLLNELFGGGFTSRLNQNLREKNGYTYGARSSFAMLPSAGWFSAASSVRADATGPAIQEFLNEFARLEAGDISDQEAAKARESQRTETVQSFSGLSGVLGVTAECLASGLPFSAIASDMKAMQSVDAPGLNAASKIVDLDRAVLVLVGDKATILEHLKPLNLPAPVEYTARGETVK